MFNVADVVLRAEQALVKNQSNPEESRQIFLEEILDWTDNYSENKLNLSSSNEAKEMLSNITKLWVAYCTMEISLRQFKQAVKIFEDAISDPVASRSADIYMAYVDYCKTRGKLSNTKKVYIKGLSSSLAQDEADKLWISFLPFIRSQVSPDITMSQLYEAVRNEAGVESLTPPGPGAIEESNEASTSEPATDAILATQIDSIQHSNNSNTSQNIVDTEPSSRMVLEESYVDAECKSDETTDLSSRLESTSTDALGRAEVYVKLENVASKSEGAMDISDGNEANHNVKSEKPSKSGPLVDSASGPTTAVDSFVNPGGVGDDLDSVAGLTPEQLTRMYRYRPPMLFSAPNKEPTLFGLSSLSSADTSELEAFLGVTLSSIRYGERQLGVDIYLDLVEGLWTAQALKERHFDSWFTDLKKLHEKEGRDLSRACEEKEKEAAVGVLLDSAKEKNQADRKRFRSRCAVQREVLHAVVNKTTYALLMDQQRALVAAGFPKFSSSVVERIQQAMAALKSGVAAAAASASTPAAGGQPASNFDPALLEELAAQKRIMCALLSLRVNLAPNPQSRAGSGSGRRDGSEDRHGAYPLMRGSSVGSDYHSGGQNSKADYYSQDAKQQRKAKRRKIYPAEGGDEIRFDDRRMRSDNGPGDRRQGPQGQGPVPSYQGPDHLRRGAVRRVGGGGVGGAVGRAPIGRNTGSENNTQQFPNAPQNQKNTSATASAASVPPGTAVSEEPAPLTLLQKLATMIQKVKK